MNVLAVVAHPDDLEIAAAGTIRRLIEGNHQVFICVVTDEDNPAICRLRRKESIDAAVTLGIDSSRVLFLGQQDRFAQSGRQACIELNSCLAIHGVKPDMVITHSQHDNHQDHRAVHDLVVSALGDKVALFLFAAVVNSLRHNEFAPKVFVDTTRQWQHKVEALSCYESQAVLGRIRTTEIDLLEREHSEQFGLQRVESFELTYRDQYQAAKLLAQFALQNQSMTNIDYRTNDNDIELKLAIFSPRRNTFKGDIRAGY